MEKQSLGVCMVTMVMLTWLTPSASQDFTRSCCSANLMDSGDKVVIDTLMARSGTFKAIKVLMCTTTLTYVQLWRRLDETNYQLFYQWDRLPNMLDEYTLAFDEDMNITEDIKLGLFSPGFDKHNVPYIFSISSSHSLVSVETFQNTHRFSVGDEIVMDRVIWPRTFRYNAVLCVDAECTDIVSLLPLVIPGPVGPPGPPGPAGSQGEACNPFEDNMLGDAMGGINNQMNDIRSDTLRLEDLIKDMGSKINELTQSNFVTGVCPPGYLSGTYGVGSCYIIYRHKEVHFYEAHFSCVEDYKGHIVDIFSELEQTYLRNTITQLVASSGNGGIEEYWTSGMYSDTMMQWVWYDEVHRMSIPMIYENWYTEAARSSDNGLKICMKLVIDAEHNQSYWMADYCESKHFFICKVDKKCL